MPIAEKVKTMNAIEKDGIAIPSLKYLQNVSEVNDKVITKKMTR